MGVIYKECILCEHNKPYDEGEYCDCDEGKKPDYCPSNNKNNRYSVKMELPKPNNDYSKN